MADEKKYIDAMPLIEEYDKSIQWLKDNVEMLSMNQFTDQMASMQSARKMLLDAPDADVVEVPDGNKGKISDGYHSFDALYHQRAVLFAALVKTHKERAWKSWRHYDGELPFGKTEYFIVGIDTPEGTYTYHYHGEYWDMFDCKELPRGKEWDGHTDQDVARLLSLPTTGAGMTEEQLKEIMRQLRGRTEDVLGDLYVEYYEIESVIREVCGLERTEADNGRV